MCGEQQVVDHRARLRHVDERPDAVIEQTITVDNCPSVVGHIVPAI
jgi:hypothetical protein